ncbi:MAG: hypothetical protein QM535_01515 [Limnohabitans sp.]|nr:hypothetical protein [Limnohabitans sp.]
MRKIILLLFIYLSYGQTFGQQGNKTNLVHFKQYKNDTNQSIYFADFDASRRGTVIVHNLDSKSKNPVRILAEPPPDAILAYTSALSANFDFKEIVSGGMSSSLSQTISELTKRNTTIVILRDALYRLNEYDFNNPEKLKDTTYLKKFDEILKLVKQINDKEKVELETEKIKAETEKTKETGKLNALELYQKGISILLEKDEKNAIIYFNNLYKEYPKYFNVDEINKKLIELSTGGMTEQKWKQLYEYILKGKTWRINSDLIDILKEKSK